MTTTIAPQRHTEGTDRRVEEDGIARSITGQVVFVIFAIIVLAAIFLSATAHAVLIIDDKSIAADTDRARLALSRTIALDAEALAAIEETYQLSGARLVLPDDVRAEEASLATGLADGRVLAWVPRRMGTEVFFSIAPIRISAAVLLIGAIAFVLHRLHALARHLDRRRAAARSQAVQDALTGVANRLGFNERLNAQLEGTRGFALVLLDLDGFKSVNDRLGHLAGDVLLREMARRIAAYAGPEDLVARLGGDEFAVIRCSGLGRAALEDFATDLVHLLSAPFRIDGRGAEVTVSIGIARVPEDGRGADAIIHAADAALYRAKAHEGGRFAFAAGDQRKPLALVGRPAA